MVSSSQYSILFSSIKIYLVSHARYIFCLPGLKGGAKTAWRYATNKGEITMDS